MKTILLVTLLLASSSVSFAQTNCTRYLGGEISCTGPNGYQMEGRQHINGQTSYYDNLGNQGTVNQHLNGGVSITPTQVGRAAPPPGVELSATYPDGVPNVGSRMVEPSPALRGLSFSR